MTQCIRCNAEITQDGRLWRSSEGLTCPRSLPGQAAVHRVTEASPTRSAGGGGSRGSLWGLVLSVFGGYYASKAVSSVVFPQHHNRMSSEDQLTYINNVFNPDHQTSYSPGFYRDHHRF